MRKLKNFMAFLFIAIMLFSLTACSKSEKTAEKKEAGEIEIRLSSR